ncbi:MAG: MFS transporter [Promethearchaeota archaeon]|nr:MAG: MFS transporter [Candidatus Lokiarchaeota archaeon]
MSNSINLGERKQKELRILSTREAIIYGLPNAGLQAIFAVSVNFTLLFYINVMGQPPIIAGTIYSASLYFYAFMCIVWGVIADKIGKKKVLIITGPLLAISFIFLWFPPIPNTDYGQIYVPLIIWLTFFSFVFRSMCAGTQSSIYGLLPELSTDEQNRVKISMIGLILIVLGIIIGTFIPFALMGNATQNLSREDPDLYYNESSLGKFIYSQILMGSLLVSFMFLVLLIIMLIFIKEPSIERSDSALMKEFRFRLMDPFKDKNNRRFLASFFLFWIPFVALQYLVLLMATFVLDLRGIEFIILIGIAFVSAILSFGLWQALSKKHGLKKTMTICLFLAGIAFSSLIILIFPMDHLTLFILGSILISFTLCTLVGTMVFPFAILSDIVDAAEIEAGRSLSGSYSGAFTMVGCLASGTAMLIISFAFEIFGPTASISYGVILSGMGTLFIIFAIIVFQKVQIKGNLEEV